MLLDNIGEVTWNTHFADVYVYNTTAIDTLSIVIRLYINYIRIHIRMIRSQFQMIL
jgi:hypothetical protein